jgi:hypothetical protein
MRDVVSFMDGEERSCETSLTFIGLFGIVSLKVSAFTDMVERQRIPIPEPQHTPHEGGNGSLGLPPTLNVNERSKPPPEGREGQPLPSVLEILECGAQLLEDRIAEDREKWSWHQKREAGRKFGEAKRQQENELARLYTEGTERDRLIINVYTTMTRWGSDPTIHWWGLSPEQTRDLIARVAPMSEVELREELHRAEEAWERKRAIFLKRVEYSRLRPEDAAWRRREDKLESNRRSRQRRKERARLRAEQHQQVFPPPTQE